MKLISLPPPALGSYTLLEVFCRDSAAGAFPFSLRFLIFRGSAKASQGEADGRASRGELSKGAGAKESRESGALRRAEKSCQSFCETLRRRAQSTRTEKTGSHLKKLQDRARKRD